MKTKLKGDFRIVNWNTANIESNYNEAQHIVENIDNDHRIVEYIDNDQRIVDTVLKAVNAINANVITLQELGSRTFILLQNEFEKINKNLKDDGKKGNWRCYFQWFGLSGHATCVYGISEWVNSEKLSGTRFGPSKDWWGYMQITLNGVMITNVHTRDYWDKKHVDELHKKISTGIIAGDFNYNNPGWYQTDNINLKPTHRKNGKIDHVLAVEEPKTRVGDVWDYYNSNHRLVIAGISFPKKIIRQTGKLPPMKTLATRKLATRKLATRKLATRKLATKRKTNSKWKITKKLTKKNR